MLRHRRPHAWLALACLVLALQSAPAHAAAGRAAAPTGVMNVLKYGSCAMSVAGFTDPLGAVVAFLVCARLLVEEVQRTG